MPQVHNKILKCSQNHKSFKISFIKYTDTKPLLVKNYIFDNYLTNRPHHKQTNMQRVYLLFTHCMFDNCKSKHEVKILRKSSVHT